MQISRKFVREELTQTARVLEEKMRTWFPDLVQDPGIMNLITLLYFHEMKYDFHAPDTPGKDRIIVTLAEVFPYIFATLAESGALSWEEAPMLLNHVLKLCQDASARLMTPLGVDGMSRDCAVALNYANGLALTGRTARDDYRVYFLTGAPTDPETFEAMHTSSLFKIDNLMAVVLDLEGTARADLVHRWYVLGWHIEEADPTHVASLAEAFARVSRVRGKPSVLLC
jgi:transketolase